MKSRMCGAARWRLRSEERRVGKECRSLCDWSSDVCSSDLNDLNSPSATLEEQIAQMTAWQGDEESHVWRSALEIVKNRNGKSRGVTQRFLSWPMPKALAATIVMVLIGAAMALILLPSIGRARY